MRKFIFFVSPLDYIVVAVFDMLDSEFVVAAAELSWAEVDALCQVRRMRIYCCCSERANTGRWKMREGAGDGRKSSDKLGIPKEK